MTPPQVATEAPPMASCLLAEDGTTIPLDVRSWSEPADPVEKHVLDSIRGPVLDIGCGPGRLVVELAEQGIPALGVDASPAAVSHAIDRQATALVRSVFDPLPGTGRWATALLFDGNVGIGGDPIRLLRRVHELLAPRGQAIVEVAPAGSGSRSFPVQLVRGPIRSPWFPWAQVDADAIEDLGNRAQLELTGTSEVGGRWFARLARGEHR